MKSVQSVEDQRKPEQMSDLIISGTCFFSTCPPVIIEEALIDYLSDQNVVPEQSEDNFELEFTLDDVDIQVRILQQNKENFCVEFTNL